MSLAIAPTSTSLNVNRTQQFTASGGTSPYTFSLVSGVGAISSSGLYTAPNSPGTAVVKVTDSAVSPATVQATITVKNVLTRLCDIIQESMGLSDDQVYLWDQKINVPNDSRLYVAVSELNLKQFGSKREYVSSGGGLIEVLSVNMMATIQIDVTSKSAIARDRKEEVLMALNSTIAQKAQEANGFYIAPIASSFVNLSEIDGAAIPYRFSISVNIQYQVSKSPVVEYYDTFTDSVVTDPEAEE